MRRPHLTRLAVFAGLLAGAAAHAQPNNTRPVAYLHTADKDGTYDGREKGIGLRPNTELPFFAYVTNPSPDAVKGAVNVLLTRDKDGKLPVAKGTLAGIEGNKSVRVPLALAAPPPAPAPAKPGEPTPLPTATVPNVLYLHTETAGEDGLLKAPVQELAIGISPPANYLDLAGQPTFKQVGSEYELTVTLKDRMAQVDGQAKPFRGAPAKVRLDIRPALLKGLVTNPDGTVPMAGTYESVVPPGAEGVVLKADKLRFGGQPSGVFAVSVDGFDRAFVFDIGAQGNDATPLKDGFTRLDLPTYAVPGKPLPVRIEVFQEPAGAKPVLTFQRAAVGQPQLLTADKTTLRDEGRTLRAGEAGELVFASTVKDWVLNVDTTGVYGPRAFLLATVPPTPTKPTETVVTFDATPPAVTLETLPPTKLVGSTLQVFATVADGESGLTEVLFFLGDPPGPDGKLPPTSEGVKGTLAAVAKGGKQTPGRYTTSFVLPETKGKVKVGVRATNGAGLATTTETVNVRVVEPVTEKEKGKRTVGDIKVRVIQGSTPERPQAGMTVELRTAGGTGPNAGGIVKVAKTDDKGEATFKDVNPGAYIVYTVKLADLGAKGVAPVSVEADKQTDVTLEVKR